MREAFVTDGNIEFEDRICESDVVFDETMSLDGTWAKQDSNREERASHFSEPYMISRMSVGTEESPRSSFSRLPPKRRQRVVSAPCPTPQGQGKSHQASPARFINLTNNGCLFRFSEAGSQEKNHRLVPQSGHAEKIASINRSRCFDDFGAERDALHQSKARRQLLFRN